MLQHDKDSNKCALITRLLLDTFKCTVSVSTKYVKSQVKVMLRPTVCLGVQHPSGVYDQLRVCWCGALPLTRERVCRLQMLLVLASEVILGFESRGTRDHILLSQIRDSTNLEGQVPVFISPRNRVTQLYPQALGFFFVASYDSQGYGGGIRIHLHAGTLQSMLPSTAINFVSSPF
jgi:hypothetical protein